MIQKPKISARMRMNYYASTDEITAEKQVQIQRWLTSMERQQPPPEVAMMDALGATQKPHVDTSDQEKLAALKADLERLDSGTVARSFSGRSNDKRTPYPSAPSRTRTNFDSIYHFRFAHTGKLANACAFNHFDGFWVSSGDHASF